MRFKNICKDTYKFKQEELDMLKEIQKSSELSVNEKLHMAYILGQCQADV